MRLPLQLGATYCLLQLEFYATYPRQLGLVGKLHVVIMTKIELLIQSFICKFLVSINKG